MRTSATPASAAACSSPSAACSTPDTAALVGHDIKAAVAAVVLLPGRGDRVRRRCCVPVGLLWLEQRSGEANGARIWPLQNISSTHDMAACRGRREAQAEVDVKVKEARRPPKSPNPQNRNPNQAALA